MAVGINSYNGFLLELSRRSADRDILSFLLFDSGRDCIVVEDYLDRKRSFRFLDELADQSNSYIFVLTEGRFEREEDDRTVHNPGPRVASLFGITPNQLPGVLFFCASGERMDVESAVYFQLDLDEIEQEEDEDGFEEVLRDLYSLVQEVDTEGTTPGGKLELLEEKVARLRRGRKIRPFARVVVGTLREFSDVPRQLLLKMAESLGAAIGRGLTG